MSKDINFCISKEELEFDENLCWSFDGRMYCVTLFGDEFPNTHGYGKTEKAAVENLKQRLIQSQNM